MFGVCQFVELPRAYRSADKNKEETASPLLVHRSDLQQPPNRDRDKVPSISLLQIDVTALSLIKGNNTLLVVESDATL